MGFHTMATTKPEDTHTAVENEDAMKTRHLGWTTIYGLIVGIGWVISSWSSPQSPSSLGVILGSRITR